MAERVNRRIEDMINELEQMRRMNLYEDHEIREISRKRKEFEYRIQRHVKQKEDFVHYIAYELTLLEDITLRRKQAKLTEKKKDIEYAIAKRLNKVFKQFIYRFQNDLEVYFQYIKFCISVGFDYAVSGIIGQMLQIHGDKPKMWQMASKWECEQNNLENARNFLLKGIHRHSDSEELYLELFKIETLMLFKAETDEDRDKQLKRIDIVWRNGVKNINDTTYLFRLCDMAIKYDVVESITSDIKSEIWSKRDEQQVWSFIASKELEGCHWIEIEEFVEETDAYPNVVNNFIGVWEEALQKFPDKKLSTKFIHGLLSVSENVCTDQQKIRAITSAWMHCHELGLLSDDMYTFGIEFLKLSGTENKLIEILDAALQKNPQAIYIWKEKLLLNKSDDKKMLSILQDASKNIKTDDALHLWNIVLDNVESNNMVNELYKKFHNCENSTILSLKPKFLQKICEKSGIKVSRELYEELIRIPPTQLEVHEVMIEIEKSQDKVNMKNVRKCFECMVQHHGNDHVKVWIDYMKFEMEHGNAQACPALYRRAIAALKKELVDEFIKLQILSKLK